MKYLTIALLAITFNLSASETEKEELEYHPACGNRVYECLGGSILIEQQTKIRDGFKYSTWKCENPDIEAVTGLCQHLIQMPVKSSVVEIKELKEIKMES